MKRLLTLLTFQVWAVVLVISTAFFSKIVYSEETATTAASDGYSADEIETLIAPIALYPDELIAIVLPAPKPRLDISWPNFGLLSGCPGSPSSRDQTMYFL